jgi:hypothetical protein
MSLTSRQRLEVVAEAALGAADIYGGVPKVFAAVLKVLLKISDANKDKPILDELKALSAAIADVQLRISANTDRTSQTSNICQETFSVAEKPALQSPIHSILEALQAEEIVLPYEALEAFVVEYPLIERGDDALTIVARTSHLPFSASWPHDVTILKRGDIQLSGSTLTITLPSASYVDGEGSTDTSLLLPREASSRTWRCLASGGSTQGTLISAYRKELSEVAWPRLRITRPPLKGQAHVVDICTARLLTPDLNSLRAAQYKLIMKILLLPLEIT